MQRSSNGAMSIGRISVAEIATRLTIGRLAVYAMLEQHIIPAIRLGRRWIVTRSAYNEWEQMCGKDPGLSNALADNCSEAQEVGCGRRDQTIRTTRPLGS